MKIRYYVETDTLYIEFHHDGVVETRDLDENTLLDLGETGRYAPSRWNPPGTKKGPRRGPPCGVPA